MPALLPPQQWSVLQTHGLIQVNSTYITTKKPAGAVLMRIALLLAMFAGAMFLIALPLSFLVEDWAACLSAIGLMLIYGGVSFFLRPQVDAEGRGWRAGMVASDSHLGRLMIALEWCFKPGRFASEALLDACVLFGVAGGSEVSGGKNSSQPAADREQAAYPQDYWQG